MKNSTLRGQLLNDGYSQEDKAVYEHEQTQRAESEQSPSDINVQAASPSSGGTIAPKKKNGEQNFAENIREEGLVPINDSGII